MGEESREDSDFRKFFFGVLGRLPSATFEAGRDTGRRYVAASIYFLSNVFNSVLSEMRRAEARSER